MQTLTTNIVLKPKHLSRYKELLLSNLHSRFDNTYSKEYDCFVTNVIGIEKISNVISRTGESIIFKVTFNANKIELKVNSKIKATIEDIVPKEAIYLKQGIITIILPFHKIDTKFIKNGNLYIKNKLVKIGDSISVNICHFMYNKTDISCIAEFTDEK